MFAHLTVLDLAERVARANGQGQSGNDYWIRVFRNLHTASILPAASYRGHGRTAAALYDHYGLCLAGIAATLTRVYRLEPQAMREALPVIRSAGVASADSIAKAVRGATLQQAVDGVRHGQTWHLHLVMMDAAPAVRMVAQFRQPGESSGKLPPGLEAAVSDATTARSAGEIILNLNHVLAPYLDEG